MPATQDTRDIVIELRTDFKTMKEQVAKNSLMLEEMHRHYLKQKTQIETGWSIGQAAVAISKFAATVVGAGGLTWVLDHLPRA